MHDEIHVTKVAYLVLTHTQATQIFVNKITKTKSHEENCSCYKCTYILTQDHPSCFTVCRVGQVQWEYPHQVYFDVDFGLHRCETPSHR